MIKNKCYQVAALTILYIVAYGLNILHLSSSTTNTIREFVPEKELHRQELMSYLVHNEQCQDIIHTRLEELINLCQQLKGIGFIKDAFQSKMEEQVAKFIHVIGYNVKNRIVSFFFH